MEFKVEAASHLRRKFIEALLPSMIKQLKLETSEKALLVKVDDLDFSREAVTLALESIDSYLIVIHPASLRKIGVALAHEMVHVKQMVKGQLRPIDDKSHFWCGKQFSTVGINYTNWPWETQAYAQQELIFRRAYEGTV